MKFNKLHTLIEAMEQGAFDFDDKPIEKRKLSMDPGYQSYNPGENFSNAAWVLKNFYWPKADGTEEKYSFLIPRKAMVAIDKMVKQGTPVGTIFGWVKNKRKFIDINKVQEGVFEPASTDDVVQRKKDYIKSDGMKEFIWNMVEENPYLTIYDFELDEESETILFEPSAGNIHGSEERDAATNFATYITDKFEEYNIKVIETSVTQRSGTPSHESISHYTRAPFCFRKL